MRFPLATLLHLRRLRDEQERLKLATANLRKAKAQQDAQRIELLRKESLSSNAQPNGTWGAQMRFVRECCAVLGIHERRAKQRAEEANAAAGKQEQVYLATRQECEVLEKFREKQMEIFRTQEIRREQRDLDAAYLLTRAQRSGQALPIYSAEAAQGTPTTDEAVCRKNIGSDG